MPDLHHTYSNPSQHEAISALIRRHSTHLTDVRQATLEPLDFSDEQEILDLGCGFGFLAEEVARRSPPGTRIVGLDACQSNQRTYMHRVNARDCYAEFHQAQLHDRLPFHDHQFDKVMSSYSLYFFPKIIADVSRVLKPKGTFWCLTHSENSFAGIFRATGIDPNGTTLAKLLCEFSTENGENLLSSHFERVERSIYRNVLIFYRHDLADFLEYLRFKLPLIDSRFKHDAALPPNLVEKSMAFLDRYGRITIEKDDSAFYCRRPR
ncbi:methyltransferase domain-containing protein [bacterium]|nr:methyltransferase domain-containing protein [bacterium]